MADGDGCTCGAYCSAECCCDADWTPQELIDARAEIARLRLTDAEREAVEFFSRLGVGANCNERHAATLRGLLERIRGGWE